MVGLEILFFSVLFASVGGVYLRHRWHKWRLAEWKVKRITGHTGEVDVVVYKPGHEEHVETILLERGDTNQYWQEISEAESKAFERASALNIIDKANRRNK